MTHIDEYIAERCAESAEFASAHALESERLDIAAALTDLRRELGMSQKQLAELAGKPQSTIARIENGTLNPSVGLLVEIAESAGKTLRVCFEPSSTQMRQQRSQRRLAAFERIDSLLADKSATASATVA